MSAPEKKKPTSYANGRVSSDQQKPVVEVFPYGVPYSLLEESAKGQRNKVVLIVNVDLEWTDAYFGNGTVSYCLF